MESPGGAVDGGIGIEPWQIPRLGGTVSHAPTRSESATGTPPQGLGSTGVGGGFASWAGSVEPAWPAKGLYGGWGDRGISR